MSIGLNSQLIAIRRFYSIHATSVISFTCPKGCNRGLRVRVLAVTYNSAVSGLDLRADHHRKVFAKSDGWLVEPRGNGRPRASGFWRKGRDDVQFVEH